MILLMLLSKLILQRIYPPPMSRSTRTLCKCRGDIVDILDITIRPTPWLGYQELCANPDFFFETVLSSIWETYSIIGHMHFVWIIIYFDKYIGICNAHLFSIDALRTWNMMYDHMFQLFNNWLVSWIVSWYLWGWWSSMGGSRVVHGVTEAGPWGVLLLVSCAYVSLNKARLGLVSFLKNVWQEKN